MLTTAAQLVERYDAELLVQLTDSMETPTGDVDTVRVERALYDAAAEVEGYLYRLPLGERPPTDTLEAHQAAIAMYRLAGNRPGLEFDSIRARAASAIEWLKLLELPAYLRVQQGTVGSDDQAGGGIGVGFIPDSQFDDTSLDEFGGKQ